VVTDDMNFGLEPLQYHIKKTFTTFYDFRSHYQFLPTTAKSSSPSHLHRNNGIYLHLQ
jgi:hypothetical protein